MNLTIGSLLFFVFFISVATLGVLLWAVWRHHMMFGQHAAEVIFEAGEVGNPEDPENVSDAMTNRDLADRVIADRSTSGPVLVYAVYAVFWLIMGSVFGLVTSLKFTFPDWLNQSAWLTLGRTRPVHLNMTIMGWASMGGIAVMLWMLPRLLRTPLRGGVFATVGAHIWNLAMIAGMIALLAGWTDGVEWLEIPWGLDIAFVLSGGLAAVPLFLTLRRRRVRHLYVSVWYIVAALLWFPILFVVANVPRTHFGVEHAIVNWWFAHNVLGLWLTPIGLSAAYYLIPKIVGRPIYSYSLSLVGFWALALFYSQAGLHHLIGGPVPTWLITLSVVQSVMMVIPVAAVAINHHVTMLGHFSKLRTSPTLRFVVFGAVMYTLVSFIGSLQSLRSVNQVVHFTHYVIAHAHHGVYAFVSMILFGAFYFMIPRVLGKEWPDRRWIDAHFWLAAVGAMIYIVGLSIGGVLQGLAMLDATRPFMDSVATTIPYLHVRTLGGSMMVASHFVFAWNIFSIFRNPRLSSEPQDDAARHNQKDK